MGATNYLKEIIHKEDLLARSCCSCGKMFTGKNYEEHNWEVYFRTNNGVDWADFAKGESRGWIRVEIELQHMDCEFEYREIPWEKIRK